MTLCRGQIPAGKLANSLKFRIRVPQRDTTFIDISQRVRGFHSLYIKEVVRVRLLIPRGRHVAKLLLHRACVGNSSLHLLPC